MKREVREANLEEVEEFGCLTLLTSLWKKRSYSVSELGKKVHGEVSKAIGQRPGGAILVACETRYMPRGRRDYFWLEITQDRTHLAHKSRSHSSTKSESIVNVEFDSRETRAIKSRLATLNFWSLDDISEPIYDGFYGGCAIATADRVHAIQMHMSGVDYLEKPHWKVVLFLTELSDGID